jgi:adenosylcobinamide kinase/adenosylcobinamide-phosphate guanylyltransferase
MGDVVFVLGGARSGKSRLARDRALALGGNGVTFVATARPGDPELDARITAHRRDRPREWTTVDAESDLAATLRSVARDHVVLLDSLTLWASGAMERGIDLATAWRAASEVLSERTSPSVIVSDEVGLGIVPETAVARAFRDELGWIHQRITAQASVALFVVAGVPIVLKGGA